MPGKPHSRHPRSKSQSTLPSPVPLSLTPPKRSSLSSLYRALGWAAQPPETSCPLGVSSLGLRKGCSKPFSFQVSRKVSEPLEPTNPYTLCAV